MSLEVNYLCTYYPQFSHSNKAARTQTLWDAYKFCKAVKLQEINGHCTVPTKSKPTRIDSTNVGQARHLFAEYIKHVIGADKIKEACLVPVPSKDSFDTAEFRSLVMVRQGFSKLETPEILPALKFDRKLEKASEGGMRGADAVYPFLKVVENVNGKSVYLVDDILTSGGSLLASKHRLEEAGATVLGAIVCGRTLDDVSAAGFPLAVEQLFEVKDDFADIDVDW